MPEKPAEKPIVLGLAGYGTVGTGLARILADNAVWIRRRTGRDIVVKSVLVRDPDKTRPYPYPEGAEITDDLNALVTDPDIDIVVELIGGIDTAYNLISQALAAGKHVVTANKALLAERGQELFALADRENLGLYYEASAVGGVPVIQTLKESLAANHILKVTGILNGTSNFILSEMTTNGLDFDTALAQAQALGYAEADPTLDIEGHDTAHKLVLLIRLAWGVHYPLQKLPVNGIKGMELTDIDFARELGYRVKLIGQVREEEGKLEAGVYPALVKYTFLLARVGGNYNACRIEGNAVGPIMLHGQGAGDLPTGSAVLGDIIALIKDRDNPNNTGFLESPLPDANILDPDLATSQHYFRFTVADRPGVMSSIAQVMADNDISIHQAIQKGEAHGRAVPIVFTTHEAKAKDVNKALAEIDAHDYITAPTIHYRIL